ncbi:CLUMA_CG000243, isoform A [Clunio marinus]|uniref:CLUMA_CG000243, isoform A n=1 Tax=Clunio marinus TaxID=568069 RepID=A0A1J1HFK7_9DIPT|nr:CLUMA_CG000243, isoform A [Clunio marinus]
MNKMYLKMIIDFYPFYFSSFSILQLFQINQFFVKKILFLDQYLFQPRSSIDFFCAIHSQIIKTRS